MIMIADLVERMSCMDEVDVECTHCGGLTGRRNCGGWSKTHCVHCGNPLTDSCKQHRVNKKAEVPRYANSIR